MKQLGIFALVLALTGCALSPQQVTLQPTINYTGERVDVPRAVVVSVVDERANPALGSRGGVYGDTSTITLGNDLGDALTRALSASLAAQGFAVNAEVGEPVRLQVTVEELAYTTPEQDMGFKAAVMTAIKANAWHAERTFEGRYRVGKERNFVTRPNEEANSELINATVSEVLERMFDDPKLQAFLRGN